MYRSGCSAPLPFQQQRPGRLGLPFAFATHIRPDSLGSAIETYRSNFKASPALDRPHVMVGVLLVAADTDEVARHLFTSMQQVSIARLRGDALGALPPPINDLNSVASAEELTRFGQRQSYAIVGSRETVRRRIEALIAETAADELIFLTLVYDQDARRRSFEIAVEARDRIAA